MNVLELLVVPEAVVTAITPVVADAGTVAVIVVEFTTVNVEVTPLNVTAVAPVKLLPLMVTDVPTPPAVGLKPVMLGGVVTVKLDALVPVPEPFTTLMVPVVAPLGTVAVMLVAELTVYDELIPLNLTAVIALNSVPVMVTEVPIGPEVGVKEVILGTGNTVKVAELLALPAGLVTVTTPLVDPFGTVQVIVVLFTITKPVALVVLN